MTRGGRILLLGLVGAAITAFEASASAAPAPDPDTDCHSDGECLGKRFAVAATSKVSTAVDVARLSSTAPKGALTGEAWVRKMEDSGLSVVAAVVPEQLVEGSVLLAVRKDDADALVSGGLFRRVRP